MDKTILALWSLDAIITLLGAELIHARLSTLSWAFIAGWWPVAMSLPGRRLAGAK